LKRCERKLSLPYTKYYRSTAMEGLSKTTYTPRHNRRSPGRYRKPRHP